MIIEAKIPKKVKFQGKVVDYRTLRNPVRKRYILMKQGKWKARKVW